MAIRVFEPKLASTSPGKKRARSSRICTRSTAALRCLGPTSPRRLASLATSAVSGSTVVLAAGDVAVAKAKELVALYRARVMAQVRFVVFKRRSSNEPAGQVAACSSRLGTLTYG